MLFALSNNSEVSLGSIGNDPGNTGTPASIATLRALPLSAINSMVVEEGPTHNKPAASTFWANKAFSDRRP